MQSLNLVEVGLEIVFTFIAMIEMATAFEPKNDEDLEELYFLYEIYLRVLPNCVIGTAVSGMIKNDPYHNNKFCLIMNDILKISAESDNIVRCLFIFYHAISSGKTLKITDCLYGYFKVS